MLSELIRLILVLILVWMLVCSLVALFRVQALNLWQMDCRNIRQCISAPHLKRLRRWCSNWINSLWVNLVKSMDRSDCNRMILKMYLQFSNNSILLCSSSSSRSRCCKSKTHYYNRRHTLEHLRLYLTQVWTLSSGLASSTINSHPYSSSSSRASYRPGSMSFCSSFCSSICCSSSSNSSRRSSNSSSLSSSSVRHPRHSQYSIRGPLRRLVSLGVGMVLPVVEPVVRLPGQLGVRAPGLHCNLTV